jgi:hypothetical protein
MQDDTPCGPAVLQQSVCPGALQQTRQTSGVRQNTLSAFVLACCVGHRLARVCSGDTSGVMGMLRCTSAYPQHVSTHLPS